MTSKVLVATRRFRPRGVTCRRIRAQARAGRRGNYRQTLGRPDVVHGVKRRRVRRKLPTIPTCDEVERILEQLSLPMQAIAVLAYGSGLRVSEICQLRIEDTDSKRMQIHIERGKGDKQRRALLSHTGLALLRAYWKSSKVVGPLLFPVRNRQKALTRAAFIKSRW